MFHQVILNLPDAVYKPLADLATEAGRTVEDVAQSQLAESLQRDWPGSRLRKWAGKADSGRSDVSTRHHDYLGEALRSDPLG